MYGRESWTIKKAECQRIDAFHLWCWRKLLRVPWTATRPKQSILKEISPEYSLEGLMLKLKLWHFGHPLWKANSLEKTPVAGKDWMQEKKGMTEDETAGWHHWLDGHEFEQALGDGDGQGGLAGCRPWGLRESDTAEQLNKHPHWGPGFIYAFLLHSRVGSPQAWVKLFLPTCVRFPFKVQRCFYLVRGWGTHSKQKATYTKMSTPASDINIKDLKTI